MITIVEYILDNRLLSSTKRAIVVSSDAEQNDGKVIMKDIDNAIRDYHDLYFDYNHHAITKISNSSYHIGTW